MRSTFKFIPKPLDDTISKKSMFDSVYDKK